MSIQSEIQRLNQAKQNLKTAITGKGVAVSDSAKLDTYYTLVNEIQQGGGESGGTDVSATTATEDDVLNGKKFYKADGTFVEGDIQTVTPTLTDNVFTVEKGYVSEKKSMTVPTVTPNLSENKFTVKKGYVASDTELTVPTTTATLSGNVTTVPVGYIANEQTLTVPESQITETSEKVTIGVGYISEQKEFSIQSSSGETSDEIVGVLVDGADGQLMFQELEFYGTTPAEKGSPISFDGCYMYNTGKDEPDYGKSNGGWVIFQIKSYIAPNSTVQSYKIELDSSFGEYATKLNGIYERKTKEGYYDRYINHEKGKVIVACASNVGEATPDNHGSGATWRIVDVKDSDNYTWDDLYPALSRSGTFNGQNAADVQSWEFQYSAGGNRRIYKTDSNYPISVNEWIPETIIGNKVVGYSGDTPTIEDVDIPLTGKQYSVEVGKSYVAMNYYVVGHPCFMPDKRITLVMSGMDDYDANANGIYTQNDFMESSQNSTWSNSNGYTIKYDYMGGQWGCFAPNGNMVANGGYGDSPVGATWYEMVQWSGNEVTLEIYNQ